MYDIVEKLMEEKGVKASDVARETGIPSSVFTDWKKGRYTPKADKLYLIAKYFGVPMEIFFDKEVSWDTEKSYPKRPLFDVAAGQGRINDGYPTDLVVLTEEDDPQNYSYCVVHGDSMYPKMMDGDIVKVYHTTETMPTDFAVIRIDGEAVTVKNIEVTDNGLWVRAINKEVFEDRFYTVQEVLTLPITVIGVVVELQRKF